jgi:serine protease Do
MRFTIYSLLCVVLGGAAAAGRAQEAPEARAAGNRRIYVHTLGGSYLGVGVAEVNAERAKALNLKEVHGVEVTHVDENSPAAKAGLQKGDVVLEYNGQRVEGTEQFVRMVHETPVDRQVHLQVWRNGAPQTLTATIGRRSGDRYAIREGGDEGDFSVEIPPMPPMPSMPELAPLPVMPEMPRLPEFGRWVNSGRSTMLGVESEGLSGQLAQFFGVKEGVLVRSVLSNSAAEKAGMRAGDVIVKVDGEPVSTPREISGVLRAARSKHTFPVTIMRDKKELTLTVTLLSGGGRLAPQYEFRADL